MRQLGIALLTSLSFAGFMSPASAQDYTIGDLTIQQPWARATPPGAKTGGGYMTIVNKGGTADKLVSATAAAVSDNVQLHEMGVNNGIMTMRRLADGVAVPANGKVEFKPGAYHVMFLDLKAPLKQGDHVKATLVFEHAGSVNVEFDVAPIGQTTPPMKDMKKMNMPM
jgi:copper(I)-binding protein